MEPAISFSRVSVPSSHKFQIQDFAYWSKSFHWKRTLLAWHGFKSHHPVIRKWSCRPRYNGWRTSHYCRVSFEFLSFISVFRTLYWSVLLHCDISIILVTVFHICNGLQWFNRQPAFLPLRTLWMYLSKIPRQCIYCPVWHPICSSSSFHWASHQLFVFV